MFLERVEIDVREGQVPAFEAALLEVRQRVFMFPGFRRFTVFQDLERPSSYVVHVQWESVEELVEYSGSDRYERSWSPIQPYLDRAPRVARYVERDGLDLQGPGVVTDFSWMTDPP